ncbi:hypothetical protein HMPREF9193_01226 [Treponema lecithinolyticum ATCC 700332]|uniref:Uncharacterized protein n=1 Tax=Treponema lecithinolyticum ATCC 700332 TaxID=1321815 RepID=A0ABN0NZ31_TRELE|nr:hypothetical protein HMPREF9193_01226 [Treponema lecithinolyticum ATCC 700332]
MHFSFLYSYVILCRTLSRTKVLCNGFARFVRIAQFYSFSALCRLCSGGYSLFYFYAV